MSKFKRVENEIIKDWDESYQEELKTFHISITREEIQFLIFFKTIKNPILVTMDFSNDCYPFRAPKVYIGHDKKKYKSLLHSSWKFAQKLTGVECMCCSTILCHWNPQRTMKDIIKEIIKNFNLKIRMLEIAHCRKIVEKKLNINYVPIEEFL